MSPGSRSRGGGGGAVRVEQLEQRTLLAVTANVKIPVLMFHSWEISGTQFTNVLNILKDYDDVTAGDQRFNSISLQQYLTWRNDPNHSTAGMPAQPWFIATFDDGVTQDITLANQMALSPYFYKGVSAIVTDETGDVPGFSGKMTWAQISDLIDNKGWEVASHSETHSWLGARNHDIAEDGVFRNSPSQLQNEIERSRYDIEAGTASIGGYTPLAFIHPFDDITSRTLKVASGAPVLQAGSAPVYPLAFGRAYTVNDDKFIGYNTNLANGELCRIAVDNSTVLSQFRQMLNDAANPNTAFSPATFTYQNWYRANNGAIIVDPNPGQSVVLESDNDLFVGGVLRDWANTPNYTGQSGVPSGITAFDAIGHSGNDSISLQKNVPATVNGGAGADTIVTNGGNDILSGGTENDSVLAGAGNDTISGAGDTDQLHGEAGNDSIMGENGTDQLYGEGDNDTIHGGNDNDIISGGVGADDMFGGAGTDTINYTDKAGGVGVHVGLGNLADDGTSGEGDNARADFEVIWGSGYGDDLDASNVGYNVTIDGGNANDTITGGSGNDLLVGGIDSQTNFDSLRGGLGHDTLLGGGGGDSLHGDGGDDKLDGGVGGDYMEGGSGIDTVDYSSRTASVVVGLGSVADDGGALDNNSDNVRNDIESLVGGSGNDTLNASNVSYSVTIRGGGGTDNMIGGSGADRFWVDDGLADTANGGSGTDGLLDAADPNDVLISVP